jgi:hypothetical protein
MLVVYNQNFAHSPLTSLFHNTLELGDSNSVCDYGTGWTAGVPGMLCMRLPSCENWQLHKVAIIVGSTLLTVIFIAGYQYWRAC